jgi:hypothetical protein
MGTPNYSESASILPEFRFEALIQPEFSGSAAETVGV